MKSIGNLKLDNHQNKLNVHVNINKNTLIESVNSIISNPIVIIVLFLIFIYLLYRYIWLIIVGIIGFIFIKK